MSQSKKILSTSGVSQTGQSSPVGEGGNNTGLFGISTYQFGKTGNYGQTRTAEGVGEIDTGVDLTGTPSTDIDDYYSVDMWTGRVPYGQEIVNGIDMVNNKTMTLVKGYGQPKQEQFNDRKHVEISPTFFDSERGNSSGWYLNRGPYGNYYGPQNFGSNYFQYTTSGYKLGYGNSQMQFPVNQLGQKYLGYTFRAKPKFFDVVKWTGDGTLNRQISHNLQSVPQFMIIKKLTNYNGYKYDALMILNPDSFNSGGSINNTNNMKYKLYPQMEGMNPNTLGASDWFDKNTGSQNTGTSQTFWLKYNMGDGTNVIGPTTSNFTVGHDSSIGNHPTDSGYTNENGAEYIAYMWAHDSSSSSLIRCGTQGTSTGGGWSVTVGFRPQTILLFPYFRSSSGMGSTYGASDTLIDKKLFSGHGSNGPPGQAGGAALIRRPWGGWAMNQSGNLTANGTTHDALNVSFQTTHGYTNNLYVNSQGFSAPGGLGGGAFYYNDMSFMWIAIRDSEYTWNSTNDNKGFYLIGNIKRHESIDITGGLPPGNVNLIYKRNVHNQSVNTVQANKQQSINATNSTREPNQVPYAYGSWQHTFQQNPYYPSAIRYFDRTKVGLNPQEPIGSDSGKYCIWAMKAQPKFFDVVKWTGDGTHNRQIPHNLQVEPAMILLSYITTSKEEPLVWHKDKPNERGFVRDKNKIWGSGFNGDIAAANRVFGTASNGSSVASPTSTYFTVSYGDQGFYTSGGSPSTKLAGNNIGVEYYAYLFADQKTTGNIAVGTYTGNGWSSTLSQNSSLGYERPASNLASAYGPSIYDSGVFVDLGWEPQWVMIKNMTRAQTAWTMFDTTRGWDWCQGESYDMNSEWNDYNPHQYSGGQLFDRGAYHDHTDVGHPMTKGFEVRGIGNGTRATGEEGVGTANTSVGGELNSKNWNVAGDTYLYVAVRRDEISPTEGRQVYAISRAKERINGHLDDFTINSAITSNGHRGASFGAISSTSTNNDHQVPSLFKPDLVIVNDTDTDSGTYNDMRILTRGWGKYSQSTMHARDNRIQSDLFPQTSFRNTNPFSMSSGFGLTYPQDEGTWAHSGYTTNAPEDKRYAHMFRRAKGFMDIIHYRGSGTTMTKPHALGVAPEMLIFRMARFQVFTQYSTGAGSFGSLNSGWHVYHKDMTPAGSGDAFSMKMMFGLGTGSWTTDSNGYGTYRADDSMTNTNTPNYVGDGSISVGSADDASGSHFAQASLSVTTTDITIGGAQAVNSGGSDPYYHQCIMFATLPGVSKVGYYLGTGTSDVNVNCGFSGSARFILIKREDDKGPWILFEGGDAHQSANNYYQSSIRTGASDYFTYLNRKDVALPQDVLDPFANGFTVKANSYTNGATQSLPQNGGCPININGARYIFLAIA